MSITASMVKELREKTGVGMMDCKKALQENDGNIDKAIDYLRTKGLAKAAKKAERIAAEGTVAIASSSKLSAIVEVNSETDFVAKNDNFKAIVSKLADQLVEKAPENVDAMLSQTLVGDSKTVGDYLTDKISSIGENIKVRRFSLIKKTDNNHLTSYIHMGGQVGVVVELVGDKNIDDKPEVEELGKDIALHICASAPKVIHGSDLPQDIIEAERKIYIAKAKEEGKPEKMLDRIVEGQVNKLVKQSSLLTQDFVKNPDITIEKYLAEVSSKLGITLSIKNFVRYALGEGIEKKTQDFAQEVMEQIGSAKS